MISATMYGWARSPTWPNSVRDTNIVFDKLVREIGLSRGGPRYIMGDFNHELDTLRLWQILKAAGWIDLQEYAYEHWDRTPTMTFREARAGTHVDGGQNLGLVR